MLITFRIPLEEMLEFLNDVSEEELKSYIEFYLSDGFLCSEDDIKILNIIKEK